MLVVVVVGHRKHILFSVKTQLFLIPINQFPFQPTHPAQPSSPAQQPSPLSPQPTASAARPDQFQSRPRQPAPASPAHHPPFCVTVRNKKTPPCPQASPARPPASPSPSPSPARPKYGPTDQRQIQIVVAKSKLGRNIGTKNLQTMHKESCCSKVQPQPLSLRAGTSAAPAPAPRAELSELLLATVHGDGHRRQIQRHHQQGVLYSGMWSLSHGSTDCSSRGLTVLVFPSRCASAELSAPELGA